MEKFNTYSEQFDTSVNRLIKPLKNDYATAAISLFLILYAGIIAPKLPSYVLRWFNHWLIQVGLFFAIVLVSGKNPTVALITAVAVLVTLMVANNQITINVASSNMSERFASKLNDVKHYEGELPQAPGWSVESSDVDMLNDSADGVDGILDDCLAFHDADLSLNKNSNIDGGAITSRNSPALVNSYDDSYEPDDALLAQNPGQSLEPFVNDYDIVGVHADMDENSNMSFDDTSSSSSSVTQCGVPIHNQNHSPSQER